jgi:hypothetical protein
MITDLEPIRKVNEDMCKVTIGLYPCIRSSIIIVKAKVERDTF